MGGSRGRWRPRPRSLRRSADSGTFNAATPGTTGQWTATLVVGVAIVVVLAGLASWLGYRTHRAHHLAHNHAAFVAIARQGALNLANIRSATVEDDVKRVVESSINPFLNDFQQRSASFIDFVVQANSSSEATVREVALESAESDRAQVLVALSVQVSADGEPQNSAPRHWRMRITVQRDPGGSIKMSNVEFIP